MLHPKQKRDNQDFRSFGNFGSLHSWLSLALAIAMAFTALIRPAGAQYLTTPAPDQGYLPGQVLVKYERAEALPHLLTATARWQTQILGQIPQLGVALLRVPVGLEKTVLARLQRNPFVQYVELNYLVHALEVPDDPFWPQQWALPKIGAPQAWDIARCLGTIVAVLDTGVHLEHPDLRNVLWTNPGEIPGNGIDDDGNGKVDDVHGWHFYQNCSTGICEPYENRVIADDNGHGTHVTGIIAAETDNAIGIAGVSWGARAMIVKVLDQYGFGPWSDVAAGIIYATDNGAQIINLSLGDSHPSQLLQDAVNYAYHRGVLLIAACGNEGKGVFYPAACENVMAVAVTDSNDKRPDFSNYGPEVDIAAPGGENTDGIVSTWPWRDGYYYKYGTSMAAAHVSGAAALLWSWRPDFTNDQIQQRLETQADDVNADTHPGPDPYLGWGRLNIYRALAGLAPGPTRTPTATATLIPTPSATPSPTQTLTPTSTPTPIHYLYYLLPIFKNFRYPAQKRGLARHLARPLSLIRGCRRATVGNGV